MVTNDKEGKTEDKGGKTEDKGGKTDDKIGNTEDEAATQEVFNSYDKNNNKRIDTGEEWMALLKAMPNYDDLVTRGIDSIYKNADYYGNRNDLDMDFYDFVRFLEIYNFGLHPLA